jgi:solute carrier family 25 carnitine/acylcarnitine transporter 20/29
MAEEVTAETKSLTSSNPSILESLLAGAAGGISLVLVGHPFDLVKVRVQTSRAFSSSAEAFKTLLSREGLSGVYRGVTAPLLGVAPIFAINIWGYDQGRRIARQIVKEEWKVAALGGAFAALPTSILQVPGDRIKLRLQVSNAKRHDSPVKEFKAILAEGAGWGGLYRGYWITLAREIPGSAIYFANYAWTRQELMIRARIPEAAAILIAGGLAGTLTGILTLPIDTVKSRYQAAPEGTFKSARQVLQRLISIEGPGALFRGLGPVVMRAFPANAACFSGIEAIRCLMI